MVSTGSTIVASPGSNRLEGYELPLSSVVDLYQCMQYPACNECPDKEYGPQYLTRKWTFGMRFLKINNDATSGFEAAYLRNGKSYSNGSSSILLLILCPLTLAHKIEIDFLRDKGPFPRACHIYITDTTVRILNLFWSCSHKKESVKYWFMVEETVAVVVTINSIGYNA